MLVEPLPGGRPAILRPVTQSEQRLLAAERGTLTSDLEHLVGREKQAVALAAQRRGVGGERAVVATVTAEPGQGDEDLAAVSDNAHATGVLEATVTHRAGKIEQRLEVVPARMEQRGRLVDIECDTTCGTAEGSGDLANRRNQGSCHDPEPMSTQSPHRLTG